MHTDFVFNVVIILYLRHIFVIGVEYFVFIIVIIGVVYNRGIGRSVADILGVGGGYLRL
jgi:hypothetical protein